MTLCSNILILEFEMKCGFQETINTSYGGRATDISTRRQNLLQGKPQTERIFEQGHLSAKPAMDAGLVSSIIQVKDDPNVPINMKWGKIRTMLLEKGLAWTSQEAPSAFLCHPSNRGGLMLSWHDCHDKGSSIVSLKQTQPSCPKAWPSS